MKIRQIPVFIENQPGRIYNVVNFLGDNNINIRALSLADTTDFGIIRFIVEEPEKVYQLLKNNNMSVGINYVIAIAVQDTPGSLAQALKMLSDNDINVEYTYSMVVGRKNKAVMIFSVEDIEKACEIFKCSDIEILTENTIADK